MSLFAVSRRSDPTGALLVVRADSAEHAAHIALEQEELGALKERGYRNSPQGYVAVPATEEEAADWTASLRWAAFAEYVLPEDEADWIAFLRPPEMKPVIVEGREYEAA
jgi:hypothetical protein